MGREGKPAKKIREKLAAMNPTVAHAKSMAACKRLMAQPEFQQAQMIMIYLPLPDEVETSPIALRGWQQQKTDLRPRSCRGTCGTCCRWRSARWRPGWSPRAAGCANRPAASRSPSEMLDLVIVPALAYDRSGNRLGRGAGFYDRFLASPQFRGVAVGLAFREQLVEDLPAQENDVPVHVLVTDEEVLRFAAGERGPDGGRAGRRR